MTALVLSTTSCFTGRLSGRGRCASLAAIGYLHAKESVAALREWAGLSRVNERPDSDLISADHAAMMAIAAGDETAFARLVEKETPRLLRFARSTLSAGTAEAEEVVQEALLRLWNRAGNWQPNGRVSTWLHQVVYRLCIDTIRRRMPSVAIEPDDTTLEDDAPHPDAALIRADDVRLVRAALERLPERQRTALALFHFQELGQADSAAIMGIGEHAFESLLARARRGLRAAIAAEENEGGMS